MKIAETHSHLNGEEYIIVHHNELYSEIKNVVESINADSCRAETSQEKGKFGEDSLSSIDLNRAFEREFYKKGWFETRQNQYLTNNRKSIQKSPALSGEHRGSFLKKVESNPVHSNIQTDFVVNKIAIEVQLGKYSFADFDLFAKSMLFYSGGVINLGVEILPTKAMQSQMSSGVAYYEGEVYNVMRQGRNSPPVPLLILGIEP